MVFEIVEKEDKFVDGVIRKSIDELNDFFEINWTGNLPRIFFMPDRKTCDYIAQKKTEDWGVGWVYSDYRDAFTAIFILSRENYEKESCHEYSDERYAALIKHELCHAFIRVFMKCRGYMPVWLNEGLCTYLSGQNKFRKRPEKFSKFLDYYDSHGPDVYHEPGFVVKFLVEKFGRKKFMEFLEGAREICSREEFDELFKRVFEREIGYDMFG